MTKIDDIMKELSAWYVIDDRWYEHYNLSDEWLSKILEKHLTSLQEPTELTYEQWFERWRQVWYKEWWKSKSLQEPTESKTTAKEVLLYETWLKEWYSEWWNDCIMKKDYKYKQEAGKYDTHHLDWEKYDTNKLEEPIEPINALCFYCKKPTNTSMKEIRYVCNNCTPKIYTTSE